MKVMDARTRYSTSNLPHSYFEMQGEMEGGELSAAACGPSPVMKLEVAENGVEQATSRNGRRSKQCLKSRHPSSFALPFMSDALSLSSSPLSSPPPPPPAPLSAPIGRLMAAGGDAQRPVGRRTAAEEDEKDPDLEKGEEASGGN